MNKCLLSVASVLLLTTTIVAQQPIVLQSSDYPSAGFNHRVAVDTFPLPSLNFGQKGANRTYDFSNLVLFKNDTIEHRALTQNQLTKFPNANLAITTNGSSFLFTKTNTDSLGYEGLDGELLPGLVTDIQFSPKPKIHKFPIQFGGTFSGSYGFTKIVSGSSVGQPLVANVKVEFTASYSDTIDGWGKVITPAGAYKCLRQQRHEKTRTKIDASSLFTPGVYSIAVSDRYDTTNRYSYLTKEAKGSVVTFTFDTAGYANSATWSLLPPAKPTASFTYTVGANGQVTFTDNTDGYPTTWSWNYGDNTATGSQQNPTHTYAANGKYYVCLTVVNAGGSDVFCDTVRVTTIAAVNQKPMAKNDTVTTTQPDSVIIAVLANDTDPDFNALTPSIISSPQNGTTTLNGNLITYKPNALFFGLDSFDYKVCDNGSPSLCDTARVYIEVKKKIVLPVASFTYTGTPCASDYVFQSTAQNADSLVWKIDDKTTANKDTTVIGNSATIRNNNFVVNYDVCLYAYNEDGVDSSCTNITYSCVGINEEVIEEITYALYPNPARDVVYVRSNTLPVLMGVKAIRLYDLAGRLVHETNVAEDLNPFITLNTADIQSGTYIAEVVLQSNMIGGRSRLVIQR